MRHRIQLPGHVLQKRFVPNTPVAVEIAGTLRLFIVFAAVIVLDAGLRGVSAEPHRSARRAVEERGPVALVVQDFRQCVHRGHRLWQQYERRFVRRDRRKDRRQCFDRLVTVGEGIGEVVSFAHQRVEKRGKTFSVRVKVRVEQCRMFTAETFEYEENDIALAQRGSPAVGMVVRGVQRVERSLVEKFLINDRLVAERPDQAERVAQDQVRFQVGGRIEGRVTEGDRPCLAAEPAADAAHDQSDRNGQHGEVNAEIGPSVFNPRGHRFDTAVNPHHRGNQQCAPQDDIPVLGQTFENDRSGVVVIMQVGEFVRGEPFAGVMEIDAVGGVDDQRERVGNGVEPAQYSLVPSCFAEPER